MIRNGPIPLFVHSVIEYAAGVLFVIAPFVFGFSDDGAPTAVSIVTGVLVLLIAASTNWGLSLTKSIPLPAHILLDYALGAVLIAAPFLFGFSSNGTATPFFIVLGIVHLLLTTGTRFGAHADVEEMAAPADGPPAE